jgi:hypothetical protein
VDVEVERVPTTETLALRHAVLRPHLSLDAVSFAGDDDLDTASYAARDAATGEIVATGSVRPEQPPWAPGSPTHADHAGHAPYEVPGEAEAAGRDPGTTVWRLRGMATAEGHRGAGLGRGVLAALVDHVAAAGGGLLWCSARIKAVPFYERGGFVALGEPYDEPVIGTHVLMWTVVGKEGRR